MPKINIDSPVPGSPRVEVGWARDGGHVQVHVEGTASLDHAGVVRLIRALNEADGQAFGAPRPRPPRTPSPAVTGRNLDLAQVL